MTLVPLGQTARFINGAAFKPSDWESEGLPIIRIQNLTGTGEKFNLTTRQVKPELIVEPGDLLVSWSATLDVYRWAGPRGVLNQHIFKVLPNAGIDPDYLYFVLKNALAELSSKTHGSTMKHVVRGDFESTQVYVPPLDEQRRIVDLLARAEGIVRLRREAEQKAAELIPALFLDMFGDPATNPKGWPVVSVGQIATYTRYGPRFPDRQYSDEGAHILRTTDMGYSGELRWYDSPMLPMSEAELEKYSLRPGTLLITRTGATIGKTALFNGSDRPCIAGAYLIEVGLSADVMPEYVLHCFLGEYGQSRLVSGSRAVAQPNINAPTICAIPVPLPNLPIQKAFVERVKGIESIQAQQAAATAKAQETFDALLAKVFAPAGAGFAPTVPAAGR